MRSARRTSLLPSRSEIRNRHSRFLQIKNSSTPKTSLREHSSAMVREAVSGSKCNGRPRIPGLFHASTSIRSNAAYVEASAWAGNPAAGSSTREHPYAGGTLWGAALSGCNPENYVPTITYCLASFTHARQALPAHAWQAAAPFPLHTWTRECKAGPDGWDGEPFPQERSTISPKKQLNRK